MYPVSDAFLRAVRSNTRKYFWTGTIVTRGGMTYSIGHSVGWCFFRGEMEVAGCILCRMLF